MSDDRRISLIGSVSLGTGVMIGAGIFALVGQVAVLAGDWFPIAFAAGAVVAGGSSYAYIRYSTVNPSSGGVAMLLKDAYGPGATAGSFALFMYVSMLIAESLLARTFGTYLLTPFGLQDSALLVPILGVIAIVLATTVNLISTALVEGSALTTAVLKVTGLAALAVAGLIASFATHSTKASGSGTPGGLLGVLAASTLCVLAYKGFTTITNQGDAIRHPERNIARSIVISLSVCAVLYLLITISVQVSIGAQGAVDARDYALARAAEPLFGAWGVGVTVAVAIVATLSGLVASLFSVSRLLAMLQSMGQAPSLPARFTHQPLLLTAALALLATAFLDLSQIASIGAFLYLSMDIAVQWGALRSLHERVELRRWVPALSIMLDLAVLIPFTVLKMRSDLPTVFIAAATAAVIVLAQLIVVRRRAASS